jgi:hypothetical protein
MPDYSKMSYRDLRRAIDMSPTDTSHHIKAKEEYERRLKIIGLALAAVGLVVGIVWHYVR